MDAWANFTPQFNVKEIYDESIGHGSAWLSSLIYELGDTMLAYIQNYINTNSKSYDKTGNLARSIKLYREPSKALGETSWGIGLISELESLAPYYYLVNFGGTPKFGGEFHFTPGEFSGNEFHYTPSSKTGKKMPSGVKGTIAPMNFIENSTQRLEFEINQILVQYTH